MPVALIGAGYIAAYHGQGVVDCKDAELRYVVSHSGTSGDRLVRLLGVGESVTELDQVLRDPEVEAVFVASPNGLHARHAVAALEAGKAVLVEKPMAADLAGAHRMVRAAEKTGGYLHVGHMWRYDIEATRIHDEIGNGAIGKVYRTVSYGAHERWGPSGWFSDARLSGGGALVDMGVHAIDTARYLLGDPEPISVYARISTEHSAAGVDDTGLIVITWQNGIVSTIESGWWQPRVEAPEAATRLYGTAGFASLFPTYWESIDLQGPRGEDGEYPDPSQIKPEFPPRREHCDQRIYTAQVQNFVAAAGAHRQRSLRGGKVGETDGKSAAVPASRQPWEPGITVMRIIDAAYKSAETKEVIHLG